MKTSRQKLIQEFFASLACLKRALKTGRTFPFDGCVLSNAQVDALMYVSQHNEGVSVKELATYLQVTPGAITQAIDGLVEKHLVERAENESDRRIQSIRLTKKTHDAFTSFKEQYYHDLLPAFDALTDSEIETMTTLLKKIDNSKMKGGECK